MQEAARRGQLALPTFRRLNVAVMLQAVLGLTVLAQGISVRTPQLAGGLTCSKCVFSVRQLFTSVGALCVVGRFIASRLHSLYHGGPPHAPLAYPLPTPPTHPPKIFGSAVVPASSSSRGYAAGTAAALHYLPPPSTFPFLQALWA